ncbi:MAG: hypothetical protein N3I35_18675 [Clostridia bacterium]|nr:hypothetical protein [Clostridia bacterium]
MKPQKAFDSKTKGLIKMLHKKGWTYKKLAEKFYCHEGTIKRYCREY